MSQRSFTSRAARPVLILGVSAAILSLGLSACSKQKSGSPARHARTRVVSSSAAGLRDCGRHARTRVADLRDCGAYHASACR